MNILGTKNILLLLSASLTLTATAVAMEPELILDCYADGEVYMKLGSKDGKKGGLRIRVFRDPSEKGRQRAAKADKDVTRVNQKLEQRLQELNRDSFIRSPREGVMIDFLLYADANTAKKAASGDLTFSQIAIAGTRREGTSHTRTPLYAKIDNKSLIVETTSESQMEILIDSHFNRDTKVPPIGYLTSSAFNDGQNIDVHCPRSRL